MVRSSNNVYSKGLREQREGSYIGQLALYRLKKMYHKNYNASLIGQLRL